MKAWGFALFLALPALAQMDESSCPMHKKHTARSALTPETRVAYQKGEGMGMAMSADLNGYPGPRHILDLGEQLHLTSEQRSRTKAIYDSMHTDAVRLGAEIIELEERLDRAFAKKSVTPEALESLTSQIAQRQARLRYVHLKAHLAARDVLSAAQAAEYTKLRGYQK